MVSPDLLSLAIGIQGDTSRFMQELSAAQIAQPSFDDLDSPLLKLDAGQEDLRISLLDQVNQLRDLLTTPYETIHAQNTSHMVALHAIYRYKLAQAVPVGEQRTFQQISDAAGIPPKLCRRLLRQACISRIFREPSPGVIQHTPASKLIATNPHMHNYIGASCEEVWPSATRIIDGQQKWPDSTQPQHSGYFLANQKTLFETLESDPSRRARYDSSMQSFLGDRIISTGHLANTYDWAALGDANIVDIGGGQGQISVALAKEFPRLSFVVQDLPEVIAKAKEVHREDDEEIRSRVRFQEHNFLQTQPVKEAELYLFKWVLCDWPNEKVVEILRALKPALKVGSIILVHDPFVPEPGSISSVHERRLRTTDILALAIENGGSRDLGEWRDLFSKAGQGFKFKGANFIKGSSSALIEAVWTGE